MSEALSKDEMHVLRWLGGDRRLAPLPDVFHHYSVVNALRDKHLVKRERRFRANVLTKKGQAALAKAQGKPDE